MTKVERAYRCLCDREGWDLLKIERRKGGHIHLRFATGFVVAGATPSDMRNMINVRSQIRRLHR